MTLDEIAVELRSRSSHQSNDLGIAMVRRFSSSVFTPWLMLMVPVVAGAAVIATVNSTAMWLSIVGLWWIRPLFERAPRYVLSRELFGQSPSAMQTVADVINSWFTWRTAAELTFARVFPSRAFADPVWELERTSGSGASQRVRSLSRGSVQANLMLVATLFSGFGWAFLIGCAIGLTTMVPDAAGLDLPAQWSGLFDGEQSSSFSAFVVALYGAVVIALHPFYVGCCFAHYLGRRIDLEGWDIELVFRRLRERLSAGAAVLFACVLVGLSSGPTEVAAQTVGESVEFGETNRGFVQPAEDLPPDAIANRPTPAASDPSFVRPKDADATIAEILAAGEFGRTVMKTKWVPKELDEPEEPEEKPSDGTGIPGLGVLIEGFLWVAGGLGVLAALFFLVRRAPLTRIPGEREGGGATARTEPRAAPPPLSLPPHLLVEAQKAWQRGEKITSLSLLYRGLIEELAGHYDLVIGDDATAREVARIVADAGGPADYVRRLGRAWTMAVYADRDPADDEVRELFAEWQRRFGRGS